MMCNLVALSNSNPGLGAPSSRAFQVFQKQRISLFSSAFSGKERKGKERRGKECKTPVSCFSAF